jgi:RNA polymerase sigma-70 factor (ECF subfamily)
MKRLVARKHTAWTRSRMQRALRSLRNKRMACEVRFQELFEAHRAYLHRVARRLCGDDAVALAEELVQEAFVRAWRGFDGFEHGSNARAWLAKIVTRLYFDHRKHERVVENGESELMTASAAEFEATRRGISDEQLYAAVEALDGDLRRAVELCYLQQLGYREAGEILGIPSGTVGSRLARARAALKQLLDDAQSRTPPP